MTIAISLKVNDGLVLAADSASSISVTDNQGNSGIINVYDNANKVFHLHKAIPVGVITWGRGSIGYSSTSTLIKDFRDLISNNTEIKIDPDAYTVEEIAEKFYQFIYVDCYTKEFEHLKAEQKPSLGFIIGGYSKGSILAEEWRIDIINGECNGPVLLRDLNECGLDWNGVPEAITRIVKGYSMKTANVMKMAGLDDIKIREIIHLFDQHLQAPLIIPAMPIQDVIDIAHFLIDMTCKFVKYSPGPPTVGGPIEVAAITKHEGFKWISRKHYYNTTYNPY